MTTQQKIEELSETIFNKFSNYEFEALENMNGLDEFSERQVDFIDKLYEKHFGKDDEKL